MSRDYKPAPARSSSNSKGNPFLTGFLVGLLLGVGLSVGVAVLVGYALVYCLPCLVLLAVGLAHGERVQRILRRVHDRFGTATVVPASRRRAGLLTLAALALAGIAGTA